MIFEIVSQLRADKHSNLREKHVSTLLITAESDIRENQKCISSDRRELQAASALSNVCRASCTKYAPLMRGQDRLEADK